MAKTKIVVLQLKEIIYTAIFVGLGVVLILLLVFMFFSGKKEDDGVAPTVSLYNPGVYNSQIMLGDKAVNVEVVVDADRVKSARILELDEIITTMYPLVEPTIEEIELQLVRGASPEEITLSESKQYTGSILLKAVTDALNKAVIPTDTQ